VSKADNVRIPRTRGQSARSCMVKTALFESQSWWNKGQPTGYGMSACAQRCRKRYYFRAKLSLRPAHKEWETTKRTPGARSESSSVTWGWPTAREGQGHGGVIVLSLEKRRKDARESASPLRRLTWRSHMRPYTDWSDYDNSIQTGTGSMTNSIDSCTKKTCTLLLTKGSNLLQET
jgi:hypothetical protein